MKTIIENLLAEYDMSNSAFAKDLREALVEQPAQQEQEPQTSAQERTEFEQFWIDELGEADELTYGKLGYAIRRVDVAWEAWKAGKISANQQTIVGRKVWIDWKAQALELRELVRLNGIKIAELESAQSAQQEPVAWVRWEWNRSGLRSLTFSKPTELPLAEEATGVVYDPLYTSPPARKPLTYEQRNTLISQECRYTSEAATEDHHRLIEAVELLHNIKENT